MRCSVFAASDLHSVMSRKHTEELNKNTCHQVGIGMNATFRRLMAAGMMVTLGASCSTAYDAYGRPVSVVDPGMAALGVAAAGIAGYALANNNNRNRGYHRGHRGYYDNRRYHAHNNRRHFHAPPRHVRYW